MSGEERTERPTPRRLEKAREKGDRATSVLAASTCCLWLLPALIAPASFFARWWLAALEASLKAAAAQTAPPDSLQAPAAMIGVAWLIALLAAVASAAVCGGLAWSPGALRWRIDRLSPARGLSTFASRDAVTQTLLALCAVAATLFPAWWACERVVQAAPVEAWQGCVATFVDAVKGYWWRAALGLSLVSAADIWLAKRRRLSRLRMTPREVRDERSEQEGRPEHKARRRSIGLKRSRRLRVAALKRAAAVVVNPTHVAVALEYTPPAIDVPIVSVLGAGAGAWLIRTAAAQYDVPIVTSHELARALFARVDVDEPIPEDLYAAVAAVFAWILRVRGRLGGRPDR